MHLFLAVDRDGNILLIEYKHGSGNTSGIYLSPLQIGMYYDIFTKYPKGELDKAIHEMFRQRQKIGLIAPGFLIPAQLKDIIPVLIVSEYKEKSVAKERFHEVLKISREKLGRPDFLNNLRTFNYTEEKGLSAWGALLYDNH